MPSELTNSVQKALHAFVKMKSSDDHGYIASDILRTIRDESILMMEYQTICDTFDSDPLHLYEDDDDNIIKSQVSRLKQIMKVISFSKNVTKDHSFIETVVELIKDPRMNSVVNESLRLTFSFERNQVLSQKKGNGYKTKSLGKRKILDDYKNETNLTYHIDLSKDHMQKERLIDIQVYATGTSPSIKTAEPMEELIEIEEYDENGDLVINSIEEQNANNIDKTGHIGDDDDDDDDDAPDKFAAYCDPSVLENFLKWSNFDLDAQNAIFLLMTFPYYEHEWDLFGFLLECVFGCEDDEDDGDAESMETVEET